MALTQKPNFSTLEVDRRKLDNLPEVIPSHDAPEAFGTIEKEVAPTTKARKSNIWGLRRKTFWILLAAVILIIIAVVVGAAVGATRGKGSENSSDSTIAQHNGIISTSRLAAENYTDASGAEHSQLYYQDSSLQIWGADWNSSTDSWALSKVLASNNQTTITPKNGTPIATYNYWHTDNSGASDFRCVFVDSDNYIHLLYALDRTTENGWSLYLPGESTMQVSDNSSLIEYVPQSVNRSCNAADFTAYESEAGNLMVNYPFGNGDDGAVTGKLKATGVSADNGTAMAVASIPLIEKRNDTYPKIGLYLSAGGYLAEMYGGRNIEWTATDLSDSEFPVDNGAQIAAMSQYREDDYNLQILMTKTGGGVRMAYMNGDSWNLADSVDGMEDVLPLSPIAANQLGRVFALESGPQVVEWKRIDGTIPSFERVGTVNTTEA